MITISIFMLEVKNAWYFFMKTYIILVAFERQFLSIREESIRIVAYIVVF